MSEVIQNIENPEVQYILDDSQLILDSDNVKTELTDIIFSDGTTAYVLEDNSEENTFIWQDEDLNYYINDENGQLQLVTNTQIENESNVLENSEIVQYTDDLGEISESSEIVYVNESNLTTLQDENYEISEVQNEQNSFLQTFELENDVNLDETSQIQYAILKNGQLHIESYDPSKITFIDINEQINDSTGDVFVENDNKIVDISKITGKNLITGQRVSLDSYMEKIKNKNDGAATKKVRKRQNACDLKSLLNKKLTLGTTGSGKVLIGKITSVKKKNVNDSEQNIVKSVVLQKTAEDSRIKPKKVLTHEKIVTKECFEQVVKTLNGLMNMESIKRKLKQKSIVVKVVEKNLVKPKEYTKKISFCSGFMIEEYSVNENNEISQNWRFILDKSMKQAIFGTSEEDDIEQTFFSETVNVTLTLTYEKHERHIQVILNPKTEKECLFCGLEFKSGLQLKVHQKCAHRYELYECKICGKKFKEETTFDDHKHTHVDNISAHDCSECDKSFLSAARLRRHINNAHLPKAINNNESNEIQTYSCESCQKSFTTQEDLEFHKNIIHFKYRFFTCETCGKTFSRHSNLLRHIEIHQGADTAYKCTICGCSYHYASSLTRHIVQNHISDAEKNDISQQ